MQSSSVRYYLIKLIKDGQRWQYTDINGIERKPKLWFTNYQLIILIVSTFVAFIIGIGFNNDFIGYTIASLSIFIGLFLTLILSVFDKFQSLDFSKAHLSENTRISLIQTKNFFKQFTALTSYTILISLFCIFLLSISYLSTCFSIDLLEFRFISSFEELTLKSILHFIANSITVLYRTSTLYFLGDFILIVVYALSNIYTYISIEFDKVKIND